MQKKNKIILGGIGLVTAAAIAAGLFYKYDSNKTPVEKPIEYVLGSPIIKDNNGNMVDTDNPLRPGKYFVYPGESENLDRVTLDIHGDGIKPTTGKLPFYMKSSGEVELDTTGYDDSKRVASEKMFIFGKKKPIKKKLISIPQEQPKKPQEIIITPQTPEKEEFTYELFDLGEEDATTYKINIPGSQDGWFVNFSDTKAHSKDGLEGHVESFVGNDRNKGNKLERRFHLSIDVPDKWTWTDKKVQNTLEGRKTVNKFVKDILDKGYVIKGHNKEGLFLFPEKSVKEHNIQVETNVKANVVFDNKRLCDRVTWEFNPQINAGGDGGESGQGSAGPGPGPGDGNGGIGGGGKG